jgi:hypothetical protein
MLFEQVQLNIVGSGLTRVHDGMHLGGCMFSMHPYSVENFKNAHFKELIYLRGFGWLRVYIMFVRCMQWFLPVMRGWGRVYLMNWRRPLFYARPLRVYIMKGRCMPFVLAIYARLGPRLPHELVGWSAASSWTRLHSFVLAKFWRG